MTAAEERGRGRAGLFLRHTQRREIRQHKLVVVVVAQEEEAVVKY